MLQDDELPRIYRLARVETAEAFRTGLLKALCTRSPARHGLICIWQAGDLEATSGWGYCQRDARRMTERWKALVRHGRHLLEGKARRVKGPVHTLNEGDDRLNADAMAPIRQFLQAFDIRHVMVASINPEPGRLASIYLLRGGEAAAWSNAERSRMAAFMSHATECCCLNQAMQRSTAAPRAFESTAIVDDFGNLLCPASSRWHESFAGDTPLGGQRGHRGRAARLPKDDESVACTSGLPQRDTRHHDVAQPFWEPPGRRLQAGIGLLTPRETEVALHYANGYSHKELAKRLEITPNTARVHIQNAFAKLKVNSKAGLRLALGMAFQHGSS